jgi:hypothetical protein
MRKLSHLFTEVLEVHGACWARSIPKRHWHPGQLYLH